jgi:hypothetical protein
MRKWALQLASIAGGKPEGKKPLGDLGLNWR